MYCPYEENFGCPYVDTAVMDKTTSCIECEHYNLGVRPTGDTPVLGAIIDALRRKKKKMDNRKMDDWNNFMMGL